MDNRAPASVKRDGTVARGDQTIGRVEKCDLGWRAYDEFGNWVGTYRRRIAALVALDEYRDKDHPVEREERRRDRLEEIAQQQSKLEAEFGRPAREGYHFVRNLMSHAVVEEQDGTPYYLSVASESYWSG